MSFRDNSVELKEYYGSVSTVQLVEIYLSEGLTEEALSTIEREFEDRGIDPADLNKDYLNRLLVESGQSEGIASLSYKHPIFDILRNCLAFLLNREDRLKRFATAHPVLFSMIFVPILPWTFGVLIAGIDWFTGEYFHGFEFHILLAQIPSLVAWIYILWRFGWFRSTGFLSNGRSSTWMMMLVFIVFEIVISICLHPGEYDDSFFHFSTSDFMFRTLPFYLIFAFVEEVAFRGLMLYCLFRAYGNSRSGIFIVVLFSSAIFGLYHIPKVLFADGGWVAVLNTSLSPFIGGIVYCALLLHGKCIWIPVLYHALSNTLLRFVFGYWWDVAEGEDGSFLFNHVLVHLLVLACAIYLLFRVDLQKQEVRG